MKVFHFLVACGIFLLILAVYAGSSVATSFDSLWSVYQATSLVKTGNLNLDEYQHLISPQDYRVENIQGHLQSTFPIGTLLIAAPIIYVIDQFPLYDGARLSTYLSGHLPDRKTAGAEMLAASVIVALTASLLFLLALQYLNLAKSIILTLISPLAPRPGLPPAGRSGSMAHPCSV